MRVPNGNLGGGHGDEEVHDKRKNDAGHVGDVNVGGHGHQETEEGTPLKTIILRPLIGTCIAGS